MKMFLTAMALVAFQAEGVGAQPVCSAPWYRAMDQKVPSGDGQGHGPDIGSDEWKSVIEFKLGVRGRAGVPRRDSEAWCRYIDRLVRAGTSSSSADNRPAPGAGEGPSFACNKAKPGSVEAMICRDKELAALDRKLSGVFSDATRKAANERPPRLKAEQRGWIKGRNECWKSNDKRACVRTEYERRIAELQARYRLVPHIGPVHYACEGNPANEVVATFFQTDPPTLIAERGDSVSLMYLQPSGGDAKYLGRNESLVEHQGETLVTWGFGAPAMHCRKSK